MLLTWIDPSGLGHHFDCIGIGGVHFPFSHCHGAQCRSHGAQFPEAGGGHVHVFGVKDYIWQLDTEGPRKYSFLGICMMVLVCFGYTQFHARMMVI